MKTTEERFWAKVDKTGECWLWRGFRNKGGYGLVYYPSLGQKIEGAHRIAWKLINGGIPHGMCVLHHCDNPTCVRPDHLWIGTRAENNSDRDAKGRQVSCRGNSHYSRIYPELLRRGDNHPARLRPEALPRGERHGMSKLSIEKVIAMRRMRGGGCSYVEIGRCFGVTPTNVQMVCTGKTWRHVPMEMRHE